MCQSFSEARCNIFQDNQLFLGGRSLQVTCISDKKCSVGHKTFSESSDLCINYFWKYWKYSISCLQRVRKLSDFILKDHYSCVPNMNKSLQRNDMKVMK